MAMSTSAAGLPASSRRPRAASRLAWAAWAITAASLAATIVISIIAKTDQTDLFTYTVAPTALMGFATVGTLIVSRRQGNRIGWLLCWVAFAFALSGLAGAYARYALDEAVRPLPAATLSVWVNRVGVPVVLLPLPLLFLLFPDGRVPSKRWRPVLWMLLAGIGVNVAAFGLTPGRLSSGFTEIKQQVDNPIGLPLAWKGPVEAVATVAGIVVLLGGFVSAVALILRFRRSRGDERQQIKWLAYVGAAALIIPLTGLVIGLVRPHFSGADHAFPVRHQGELLGALTIAMPATDPMNPAREKLARDVAAQGGLVLRNVRLIEELRASRQRLVTAQDEERRKIERNIHDGAQQQLVALSVQLRLAESMVGKEPEKERQLLHRLQAATAEALEDLRDLARGIYPPLLADEGLVVALASQARKSPLPTDVDGDGVGRYPPEVEAAVYFCALEALQNTAKYSGASRASIRLGAPEGQVVFEVRDDGSGFDLSRTGRGTELQGMADRLEALGGRLELTSAPGRGTTVVGRIPVHQEDRG